MVVNLTPDAARIAGLLTEAQQAYAAYGKSFRGLRPGHNLWPSVQVSKRTGEHLCDGEDVMALHDLGVLTAEPIEDVLVTEGPADYGEMECDWRWNFSPLGLAVRAHLAAQDPLP